ncbi:Hypothetical predicted protein [Octopus vulgaris]|uniref:Uncharacterized protein n=1 Tax=Octopus vulgaris TaxID=6645 RepID=A0AA36B5M4_OCTVU|nr:Hypothetical predicted protein [Octopus vulgaris]
MANKSCHTQAIQVPLVNDKNEDNDMQTPTKQETGDPAEKDQTSHEKKQIQSKRSNEERPVCIHYRSNKCKHGPSDHNIIEVHLHIGNEPNATTLKQKDMPKLCRYDYHQANWETINNQLQIIDWDLYLTGPDKHKKFLNKIEEICAKNIPLKKTKSTKKPVPRERKILMRKRSRLRNKTSKLTSKHELQKVLDQIYRLEDNLKQHYDEERNNAEKRAIENIKKNPKCFYSFAKKYSNTKSTIGPLQ